MYTAEHDVWLSSDKEKTRKERTEKVFLPPAFL
jgi:hypothetical protein